MKKAICPATKEPMDCKGCQYVPEGGWCPVWDSDKLVNDAIKFQRELAEFVQGVIKKQNEKSSS